MTVIHDAMKTGLTYAIDKKSSEVAFQVRFFMTKLRGRFSEFTGTILFDQDQPEQSSASLTIDASSINTDTPDRDKNLRSEEFFAIETYPTITFQSARVAKKSADRYDVVGTLTIRGVAKEVLLPVTYVGAAKDPWGKARAGFEASLTVNRRDFGLTWDGPPLEAGGFIVGDDVTISLSIQGIA